MKSGMEISPVSWPHDTGQRIFWYDSCQSNIIWMSNVPVNSKTAHAPPRANPRAFDFSEKCWSNSPLCCQFRREMPHPLELQRGSNPPTLQACEANCGNQFCKIFSHYEFLVQLAFAPHFKQRHIPRQNYIKRQQQKNPRGIDKSNDRWTRLICRIKE